MLKTLRASPRVSSRSGRDQTIGSAFALRKPCNEGKEEVVQISSPHYCRHKDLMDKTAECNVGNSWRPVKVKEEARRKVSSPILCGSLIRIRSDDHRSKRNLSASPTFRRVPQTRSAIPSRCTVIHADDHRINALLNIRMPTANMASQTAALGKTDLAWSGIQSEA